MRQSLVEQIRSTPAGAAELALADATLQMEAALYAAADRPDAVTTIASALNLPEDRVRSVVTGEVPLRFETFVRYMSALGHRAPVVFTAGSDRPPA